MNVTTMNDVKEISKQYSSFCVSELEKSWKLSDPDSETARMQNRTFDDRQVAWGKVKDKDIHVTGREGP
jgi:hypothetical protein